MVAFHTAFGGGALESDTRSQIVRLLQEHTKATVDDLCQALGLAAATVRRHLDILQRDALVAYERAQRKAGRPEYAFFLTETGQESLPKDYGRLLALLLREMREVRPAELSEVNGHESVAELLFSRIARRVASDHEHSNGHSGADGLDERVERTAQVLEKEQFHPLVEHHPDGKRIRLLNCPFRTAALEDPSVCSFDAYLISRLTGCEVEREESITTGHASCVYHLITNAKG
ncbi:MAG: putative transcriptional regulator, ArsR family [Chloroflexi bacterium]|nr:MAG: putative transcriptional regulator, ArsR family [Chloroflexota bacterium]